MSNSYKPDIVLYRMKRSKETLNEISLHIQNKLWNTALNRIYYSCFYSAVALLASENIDTKTHAGTRQMLGLHFIKTGIISERSGEFYSDLFSLRQSADYEDLVNFEEEDVLPLVQPAQHFVAEIEQLLSNKGLFV